jgi:hypothetical protein
VGQMLNLSTQVWSLLACCCYFTNSQCKKEKKTMDSFPSFKQLLGGGSGLGFKV